MIFLSAFLFYGAGYILLPTLPLILHQRGAGPSEVGVIMGSFTVAALVLRPLAGRLLGRYSPRPLLLAGQGLLALGFLVYLPTISLWPMILGRILQGAGLAAFNTAAYLYVSELGGGARRAEFISLLGLSANVAMAIAPAGGALILEHQGPTWLFGFGAMMAIAGWLTTPQQQEHPPVSANARLWEPKAWRPFTTMLALAFAYGTVMVFVPLAMQSAGSKRGWLFFVVYSTAIITTRLFTRRWLDRADRVRWALGGGIGIACGLIVLALARHPAMFGLAAVFFALGVGTCHPSLLAHAIERVTPDRRSAATAMTTAAFDGGIALGALVSGWIIEQASYLAAFLTSGAVFIAGALVLVERKPSR